MSLRLFVLTALAVAAMSEVQAQDANPVYVVTYVEARPPAKTEAAALLKGFREAARKDDGNLRAEVVEHTSRPGQFVILTTWKDQKALDAHTAAAHTKEFRDKIHALRNSPADDRVHNGLTVGNAASGGAARPTYVVTHVDVPPPRKDDGNLRYDVVQQTNRPNHFTVVEVWKSRKAFDAHAMAAHVREFRDKLTPMSGALYDERLYRVLN